MKAVVIFVVIMIVLAFVFGFDFNVYKVDDLSVYPELDFEHTVNEFSDESYDAISDGFTFLDSASDTLFFFFQVLGSDLEVPENWSDDDKFYYSELKRIEGDLELLDKWRLDSSLKSLFKAPDYLYEMYLKYFSDDIEE